MMYIRAEVACRNGLGDVETWSTIITGYVCDQFGQVKAICLSENGNLHAVHLDEISEAEAHHE